MARQPKPTFRVMKNGYDRFAVDDAVDRYANQVEALQQQLDTYEKQMSEANAQLDEIRRKYQAITSGLSAKEQAADDIARLALKEANDIIETAQRNADSIIREALSTARLILTDLAKISTSTSSMKGDMKNRLESLIKEIDDFKLPPLPDLRWLEDAERKMH